MARPTGATAQGLMQGYACATAQGPTMNTRKTHLDWMAMLILVSLCLFWGFQQSLVRWTVPHVPPVFQVSIRFVLAAVCLWLWCRYRGIALLAPDGSAKAGLLAGLLFALEFGVLYPALKLAPAAQVTVFLYTSPLWVALLLPLLVKTEHLSARQWAGLLLAFAALANALWKDVSLEGGLAGQGLGNALALLAGLSWGLTTVVIRASGLSRISPEKTLFYQVGTSALVLPGVSLALGEVWVWPTGAWVWGSLALQSVVGAFLTYLIWMWMLTRYPATLLSAFVFLTPIFAALFGVGWFGETLTLPHGVALVGVTLGIVLVNWPKRPAASTPKGE